MAVTRPARIGRIVRVVKSPLAAQVDRPHRRVQGASAKWFGHIDLEHPTAGRSQKILDIGNPDRRPWLRPRLELSRHYVEWYGTGRQPPLKDALFWFYRLHLKDAVTEKDRPVKSLHGDVQDVLYVTAVTTVPAELHVTSGGTKSIHPLGSGIQHLRIPFSCGAQHFALYRGGRSILSGDGEPIVDRIERYDFFPTRGFAYAP